MSTVFQVPCPDCGQQMLVEADGGLECADLPADVPRSHGSPVPGG